ncbi:N-6 DNA methylase, partial [Thiolapillus sp.]
RRNRVFSDDGIERIADTYHRWRRIDGDYEDEKGFCKAASLDEVRKHNHVLTPGRYVGIPDEEDDGVPFEEKMATLTKELAGQMQQGEVLDARIRENLAKVGFSLLELGE